MSIEDEQRERDQTLDPLQAAITIAEALAELGRGWRAPSSHDYDATDAAEVAADEAVKRSLERANAKLEEERMKKSQGSAMPGVLLQLVLVCVLMGVIGCAAGAHFNFAPAGSGLAATAQGPGAEGSVTDKNGTTVVSGSFSINPIALVGDLMEWTAGLFHKAAPKPV